MRTMALTLAVTFLAATAAMAQDCGPAACCEQPQACVPAQDCGPACCEPTCVQKYCQVVCTTKKIQKTIWCVQAEDFCPSMPRGLCNPCGLGCGLGCGQGCGQACGAQCGVCEPGCQVGCGNGGGLLGGGLGMNGCGSCGPVCRPECPPSCGQVRTKKKLLRRVIVCEVPAYKCVVVCCDPGCGPAAACGGCGDAGPVEEEDAAPEEAPAPAEATTDAAPLPPIVGTSYLKALTP